MTLPGQVADGGDVAARENLGQARLADGVRKWFTDQNGATLQGALAFVPFILQQSHAEGSLDERHVIVHKGTGGVVFSEASGFASLTERLSGKTKGAEQLSQCLTYFFTPLIDLINAYRGDTIKFSGNALTIYFPSIDDTQCSKYNGIVPPHGSYGLQDLGPMATAVLRASACCIEIHKRLNNFNTHIDGIHLYLHIGVGCGEISILQVGELSPPETNIPRVEYLISGAPLEQISQAYKLAKDGETCLSPQAWNYVKECVIEGRRVEEKDKQGFHLLLRMDESRYTFPAIKYATKLYDMRYESCFKLSDLNTIRRYIPETVFKQMECGTLKYVNEMRTVSTIFINVRGLDLLLLEQGPLRAHELVKQVQDVCYAHEGTLNKFFVNDKELILLLVFGLPPLVHPDDPTRAVLTSIKLSQVFKSLQYEGRFGITTGRAYCGVLGSAKRMEYTVLGDCVNIAKKLMNVAPAHGILCDEETSRRTTGEITYKALSPISLKGRAHMNVYQPQPKRAVAHIGLTPDSKIRPPWYDTPLDGSKITVHDVVHTCKQKVMKLCSVNSWAGIRAVQGPMLGGTFNRRLHDDELIMGSMDEGEPPAKSPFADGGIVVIEGKLGMGKVELAEHVVMHCAHVFKMMPIFGTMGPRPRESKRMAVELLQSTVGVFRHMRPDFPKDDAKALERLLPKIPQLAELQELLRNPSSHAVDSSGKSLFNTAVSVVIDLLQMLKKNTPVVVVLQFDNGSNLFPKTWMQDLEIFWKMTEELAKLVQKEKSIAGLILCTEADRTKSAVKHAKDNGCLIELTGLKDDQSILEYMCNHLQVTDNMVPASLRNFVAQVTDGNPLFIRETLDQLLEEQVLHVIFKVSDVPKNLECGDLYKVNIAAWNHTTMISNTMCLIESLAPMEAAALKMSTCFQGKFTLPDLAASNCSQWGGATRFDLLRLYRATNKLVFKKILAKSEPATAEPKRVSHMIVVEGGDPNNINGNEDTQDDTDSEYGKKQFYEMPSVLMRRVGEAMVLEGQRKSVKRNALINRVVQAKLPDRMKEVEKEKNVQHIPWYYEEALRRMP